MAYAGGVVGVPMVSSAMNWTPTSLDFSSFNLKAGTGELVAIDVNTGEKLWDNRLDAVNVGSAMVGGNSASSTTWGRPASPVRDTSTSTWTRARCQATRSNRRSRPV